MSFKYKMEHLKHNYQYFQILQLNKIDETTILLIRTFSFTSGCYCTILYRRQHKRAIVCKKKRLGQLFAAGHLA